jgi:fibronectin type 3 domain-containing protein
VPVVEGISWEAVVKSLEPVEEVILQVVAVSWLEQVVEGISLEVVMSSLESVEEVIL